MSIMQKDLYLGKKAEMELLPLFREVFDASLNLTTHSYDTMDYESKDTIIELKTKNYNYRNLSDMMIGANKVKRVSDEYHKKKKNGYLVFNCLDAIYYWKFNEEEFKDAITYRMGGRMDRGKDERKICAFVNKKYLKLLKTKESKCLITF